MSVAIPDPYQQWQAAARLYTKFEVKSYAGEQDFESWGAGIIVRPHRLFVVGDLVLIKYAMGGGRFRVWGKSSKGRSVVGCYLSIHRGAHVRTLWAPMWRAAPDLDPAEPTLWGPIGSALRAELGRKPGRRE